MAADAGRQMGEMRKEIQTKDNYINQLELQIQQMSMRGGKFGQTFFRVSL
jgi:hypothetical protein